jgi:hypothetical protein
MQGCRNMGDIRLEGNKIIREHKDKTKDILVSWRNDLECSLILTAKIAFFLDLFSTPKYLKYNTKVNENNSNTNKELVSVE